ncbi:sporulation initiation inhibitor protein Soj [bacterium BMS3Abin02]|nr:sporulation initiation inhibitor protein Soj [bacterium BMS3Abin02]
MSDGKQSFDGNGILIVDSDEGFLGDARRMFEGGVRTAGSVADAQRAVADGNIDLVVLGPSFATEADIRDVSFLVEEDAGLAVVVVAGAASATLLRAAMRAGFVDVIEAPLDAGKMAEAMGQAERLARRRQSGVLPAEPFGGPHRDARVITVMSAKGGSGKTVTATNLTMLLAKTHDPSRVCIVDADLQFGDVCLVLQLEPKLTIVNASHELEHLDESLLDSILTVHPSGLRVLAAPLEPAFADEVSTAAMTEIIGRLRLMFDYVVIDTASLLDELLLSLLERSDQVLFVVDMDLPSVKNAKLALETLRLLKFPSAKIQLVLNRSNSRARLDEKEIEKSLKLKISAAIPSDAMVPASVNEGKPVVESAPRSKVAKGFESVLRLVYEPEKTGSGRSGKRRWLS